MNENIIPPEAEVPEKKNKKKYVRRVVILVLVVYLLAVAAAAVVVDGRHVRFYVSGEQDMTLEFGEKFTEPGVYAVSAGKLFGESTKHLGVTVDDGIDYSRLGTYTVTYSARCLFRTYTTSRSVTLVDTTPPVIELKTVEGYTPSWFTGYEEEGYTATDLCDGDLTAAVRREELEDRVVYTVSDSSGNEARVERPLAFMDASPVIELYGEADMTITAGMSFADPGFSAHDGYGNDITSLVEVSGSVTPYKAGSYELVYTISSESGEAVSAVRRVTIVPVNNPDTVSPDTKTIYLTFDDGPGPYTSALLDVLKKYNVKATFFVTGAYPKYYDMIGRAYNEGHSIGVHTFSHNYSEIYASEDAFFADFNSMQEIIKEQTGEYTKLSRFPGGSSNTVSSFNSGIMSRLAAAMTDLGYTYFDWNVSSGDAGETTKTSVVKQNVIDGCSGFKASVVLQHDIKDYSVNAVEDIIIWGLNNGYVFRGLDQTSPTAHHGINN